MLCFSTHVCADTRLAGEARTGACLAIACNPLVSGANLRARALEGAFNLLYRSPTLYWLVSETAFAGHWRRWQRLALGYVKPGRLLDLGCGLGSLARVASARGWHVVGLDRSWPFLIDAHRRSTTRARPAYVYGTAAQLPFQRASFDAITMTFPTAVVFQEALARELYRVLRPGGSVAVLLGASLRPTRLTSAPLLALSRVLFDPSDARASRFPTLPFRKAGFIQEDHLLQDCDWRVWMVSLHKPADQA